MGRTSKDAAALPIRVELTIASGTPATAEVEIPDPWYMQQGNTAVSNSGVGAWARKTADQPECQDPQHPTVESFNTAEFNVTTPNHAVSATLWYLALQDLNMTADGVDRQFRLSEAVFRPTMEFNGVRARVTYHAAPDLLWCNSDPGQKPTLAIAADAYAARTAGCRPSSG